MSFISRLEYLMKKNGIDSKAELARLSGIPYTTIDGFYKKGTDNIKLSTLKRLTDCLHCSLDFLTDDVKGQTLAAHFEGEDFTEEERNKIFVKTPATAWENINAFDAYPEKTKVLYHEDMVNIYRLAK